MDKRIGASARSELCRRTFVHVVHGSIVWLSGGAGCVLLWSPLAVYTYRNC